MIRLLSFSVLFLALACATPMTRPELEAELASAGASLPTQGKPQLFPIHAGSRVEAYTQLTEERNTPETASMSSLLSRRLASGARRHATVVAGGPHAELSEQVVVNALGRQQGKPLTGLTLVFVSPAPPGPELVAAARRAKVRLRHHAIAAP